MNKLITIICLVLVSCTSTLDINSRSISLMNWVLLSEGEMNGDCTSETDCNKNIYCFGLEYNANYTGVVTSYTTGFFVTCVNGNNPIVYNSSCVMNDNSNEINACSTHRLILANCSGNTGSFDVINGQAYIIHQLCLRIPSGNYIEITEDVVTGLTVSVDTNDGYVTDYPHYEPILINGDCEAIPLEQKKIGDHFKK